ncbi:MAG: EamA family transporter [Candidatus Bathyarchaeia archaeon]|jgi:drug/metabolite transporter (DMT)-like permease
MESFAFVLIVAAAFLHAGWNVLAKNSRNTIALMWWATAFGTLGYGVAVFLSGQTIFLDDQSWPWFVISAIAETGYFVTLVRGYSRGDLSLVYPLSRGSAPIFSAVLGALMGEKLAGFGYLGIGLMVVGAYVASVPVERSRMTFELSAITSPFRNRAAFWALMSGVFIAVYSVSDKIAVIATPPLIYNWWVFAGNTILWMPVVWRSARVSRNFDELQSNARNIILTSVMTVSAYAAALAALAITSASYVVAGRGFSVVIGALLGSLLLKESHNSVRIIGAGLMFVGLTLMAFA